MAAQQRLQSTRAAQPWLDHYVRLHFDFVAFRYDLPAGADTSAGMTSETVRIRFKTPNPYYPYLEPVHPGPPPPGRELSVWLVTQERMVPVAALAQEDAGSPSWKIPWNVRRAYRLTPAALREALPDLAALIPEARSLSLQEFRDGKTSRPGWGDVLLVPARGAPFDDAAMATRWSLLPVIDPRLEGIWIPRRWRRARRSPTPEAKRELTRRARRRPVPPFRPRRRNTDAPSESRSRARGGCRR